jgi:hypothetical protein
VRSIVFLNCGKLYGPNSWWTLPGLRSTPFAGSWQDVQQLDSQVFDLIFIKEECCLLHFAVLCNLKEQNVIGLNLCHYWYLWYVFAEKVIRSSESLCMYLLRHCYWLCVISVCYWFECKARAWTCQDVIDILIDCSSVVRDRHGSFAHGSFSVTSTFFNQPLIHFIDIVNSLFQHSYFTSSELRKSQNLCPLEGCTMMAKSLADCNDKCNNDI